MIHRYLVSCFILKWTNFFLGSATKPMTQSKAMLYRPEIDGLRTISVLLVIFHHLGWAWIPGGYIGVDVFFVISGYLITKIISQDIYSNDFSISRFYKRRVIRLAPAYFTVLAVTSIAGLLVMLPAELMNYSTSVIYSTLFSANFYMWNAVGGYFGGQVDVVPLLHLWSLAVEEQFYIFWPFTLLLLLKVLPKKYIGVFLVVATLVGIFGSEWGTRNYRAAAYYLMPTRAFELLLGAVIVFMPKVNWSGWVRNAFGMLGLSAILYSALTYSTQKVFPGFSAVLPCAGAFLVLMFCQSRSDASGFLLSLKPMVYVGKISYPAYLWHWPIIAFLNIQKIEINLSVALTVVSATLLLSILTYQYIEIPAKKMYSHSAKRVIGFGFVLPALLFIAFSATAQHYLGWPGRFPESVNLKSDAVQSSSNAIRGRCNEGGVNNPLGEDKCVLGVSNKPVDFILIGDSHANHFTGMIDVMAKDANLRGYDITQSQTLFLPGSRFFLGEDGKRVEHRNYVARNEFLMNLIKEKKYKAVILAGMFASRYKSRDIENASTKNSKHAFEQGLENALRLIEDAGSKAFIIKGSPLLDGVTYDCTLNNARFGWQQKCDNSLFLHKQYFREWNALLDKLSEMHPNLTIIDTDRIICGPDRCFTEINGIPLYRDTNHLNHIGSELIGRLYLSKAGNPLKKISTRATQ